ncbi:MAG: PAS domain S-box protein [Roseateles asaccharophilus]|uniref:histidine kinase n=1 Tax=Roseateles asaccharophilus TaxID=582607 RepID=A0A4R6N7J7_9BURK|nr:PAS domain-containing sensor histidine kinase [Roseateles asaccharophilus]MDN3546086.1 PAS domain S-box protein [Roseateles asaccharophilus]TDP11185.1 multi-sensor signal transduction histidine kinase [Roseateles asaccharophilus]
MLSRFEFKNLSRRAMLPVQRLLAAWWRRQSPARQDRFATLGPLISVLLFLAAIILAFWYLRNEEIERETEAVKRDTEIAQQQIRLRLIENQEQLVRIAREIVTRQIDAHEFSAQASTFARERPEITHVTWLSARRERRASVSAAGFQSETLMSGDGRDPSMPVADQSNAAELAFQAARERRQPVYSTPFSDYNNLTVFQVQVPLLDRTGFGGVLIAEYSVEALLRYWVPTEVASRHPVSVLDSREHTVASTVTPMPGQRVQRASILHDVPLTPALNGLILRGQGYRVSIGLISNTLFWMVVALSVLTVWMLLGTWKHMRRRLQVQNALASETNFRRAMENSMLTGMRAMDMESRISYVNPAFCAMTGFSEAELIGRKPPFPYWPPDRYEENLRLQQQEVQGRSPAGGAEVRVMRKDGTIFDARMYVSPLIDHKGKQNGWMASMTNITEAKRVRDQLSASHERFTTVLEGLDAAVSVLSVQQGELLFANRSYRLWFGADPKGHALLAGNQLASEAGSEAEEDTDDYAGLASQQLTEVGSDPREVYIETLEMWFDVRARYLQWTDGRLAQMLIATDITARRHAEMVAAQQAEKAQVTSRLMTMGEMASSVAHELNQPLTAISNYCNGMVSRVRDDNIRKEDLLAALEKTAKQAQRAGQIIHRIRNFVKRSEPQRQPSSAHSIVEDAVELAGIELRRRHVAIHSYVAQRLPQLMVDPILIEQVLLNLLKNAAEAIDNANLPASRRHIELRVIPKHTPELGGHIEFSVTDMGPGLPEEVISRMYEAFFSTKADGLGIGLGLCRSIVESHQGRIRAENLYNGSSIVGCRFAFTIPVDIPRPEASGTAMNTAATP